MRLRLLLFMFLMTLVTCSLSLFAQDSLQPLAMDLFPLSKKGWVMEQTMYLDGNLQTGKREITFRVVSKRHGIDSTATEVETSVSGIFTERETFWVIGPGPPVCLNSIKTPGLKNKVEFIPPIDVVKNAMKPGQTWTWNGIEQNGKQKHKATRKFRVYGFEKVKTSAGEFKALSVEETRPGIVTRTWYAPKVGIVNRTLRGGATKTVLLLSVQG